MDAGCIPSVSVSRLLWSDMKSHGEDPDRLRICLARERLEALQ